MRTDMDELVERITQAVLERLLQNEGPIAEAPGQRMPLSPQQLAAAIDHTVLKPEVPRADVVKLCREALQYGFAAVCINPVWVSLAAGMLRGSAVKTCTVVGFPLGAVPSDVKVYETRRALLEGAQEIDMVMNVGAAKGGEWALVERDMEEVVRVASEYQAVVKVILETCLLNRDEKLRACEIAARAGAHFVKTSTGFSTGGATVEDVRLMKETVGKGLRVKASGGIRSRTDALKMLDAGADRIGTSAGVTIVTGTVV